MSSMLDLPLKVRCSFYFATVLQIFKSNLMEIICCLGKAYERFLATIGVNTVATDTK